MTLNMKAVAAIVLSAALISAQMQAAEPQAGEKTATSRTATKKTTKPAVKKEHKPTVAEQLQKLQDQLQGQQSQIDSLKSDLATKDAALQKAQADANSAQAEAARANAAASQQQMAITNNAAAVSTLDTTVKDLKSNQVSLTTTITDETTKIKKELESPTTLHYKGITLTPGGYAAAESIYRTKATGGDIATPWTGIPYEHSDNYTLDEFYGSARQSRVTLLAEGKTNWGTLRGYYEADWLGTGVTSNNNQSNSYVLRQRVLYASAETNSKWTFAGGQLWSLATETKKGIAIAPSDVLTPLTIDPNYVPGFVWTRQYSFRVYKNFKHAAFGISAENPQVLYSASLAGDTPYGVLGSAGAGGGLYNGAIGGVVATTYVKQYNNVKTYDGSGNPILTYVPVYNTLIANSNIVNYSFNHAPDVIAKFTFDPGWGHYEIFGIGGSAQETVYPGVTQNSVKYGGVTDIQGFSCGSVTDPGCGTGVAGTAAWASSSTTGFYNKRIMLGGFGGGFRVPIIKDKLTFGAKALYGPGMGRYGDSTLSDVTNNAAGEIRPIHNTSGLFTLEANPTKRLSIYLNYGGDYAARTDYATTAVTLGDPTATFCSTVAGVYTCTKSPTAANFAGTGGAWGSHFGATPSMTAIGYGSRSANNSGCLTNAVPGLNSGGSTGYLPGGSCGANIRNVQEITGGYWYDIYKGDRGRLRQAIQYGYAVREGWSGAIPSGGTAGIGAKGIDNMFWTSFRYYLP